MAERKSSTGTGNGPPARVVYYDEAPGVDATAVARVDLTGSGIKVLSVDQVPAPGPRKSASTIPSTL